MHAKLAQDSWIIGGNPGSVSARSGAQTPPLRMTSKTMEWKNNFHTLSSRLLKSDFLSYPYISPITWPGRSIVTVAGQPIARESPMAPNARLSAPSSRRAMQHQYWRNTISWMLSPHTSDPQPIVLPEFDERNRRDEMFLVQLSSLAGDVWCHWLISYGSWNQFTTI